MKLTCDDCGSIQPETNERCELCGGSLSEERERKARGSALALLAGAVAATLVLFLVPGVIIRVFYLPELSSVLFWGGYVFVWVVGSMASQHYRPKDNPDLGWRSRGGWVMDDPFTFRDNRDRAHVHLGLVLFPMAMVSGLWIAFFNALQPD